MPTRRAAMRLAGCALLGGVGGCFGGTDAPDPTGSPTRTDATATSIPERSATSTPDESTETPRDPDESTDTPDGPEEWEPAWRRFVPEDEALGVDVFDGATYAVLSDDRGGPSAVVEVDPSDGTTRWRTEFEGAPEQGTHAGHRSTGPSDYGVTPTDERIYSVHGSYKDWSALHALDRATGERLWSLRRERGLAVEGIAGGVVVVTGHEYVKTGVHGPEEPRGVTLYGIDADTGEVRWRESFTDVTGDPSFAVRDVAVGDDAAYVASGTRLVAFGLDGDRRWSLEFDHEARAARAAGERVYYLAGGDDVSTVYGLDRSGDPQWSRDVAIDEILLDGDRLYAGGDVVLALDPDGSVAWRDGAGGSSLLLDPQRETLYTRYGRDGIGAYDLPGGDELWSPVLEGTYLWPLAATAEAAVVETHEGALYAVDRADGEAHRRFNVGEVPTVFGAAAIDGRVVVGIDSELIAFDP